MPLNPTLYNALVSKFHDVKITNEGSLYLGKKVSKHRAGKTVYEIVDINRGEQYCVNCPACGGKYKLTISYICGTATPPFTEKVWHKVHCFRCNFGKKHGNAEALKAVLGGYVALAQNIVIKVNKAGTSTQPAVLESYGKLGPLLPDSSAGVYVKGRGFDPDSLVKLYNMRRMAEPVPERSFLKEYLFIPMYAEGKLVSWQARAIYPGQEPRWYIAKGGKKPVFNLDTAARTDYIFIQEGVFDAVACGPSGVAILGKSLTAYQSELLAKVRKKIIVCLDPDAKEEAKKLYWHLKTTHGSLVSLFKYPDSWPEEFDVNKCKMIPKDAASVGSNIIIPLLNTHIKNNYKKV